MQCELIALTLISIFLNRKISNLKYEETVYSEIYLQKDE